jgi:hypothetical protein
METEITRLMETHLRAAAAHMDSPGADIRPHTGERRLAGSGSGSGGGRSPHNNRSYPRPAPVAARPLATSNGFTGHGIAASGPSRLPTGPAAFQSRPGPATLQHEAARNFSRVQASAAAPIAARPNMRGNTAMREIGFENWALRHESIAALPAPACGNEYAAAGIVRSYRSRVPSAIPEADESASALLGSGLLSALPSPVSTPTASETQTATLRWQSGRARRVSAVVHAGAGVGAAPMRSQKASLVPAAGGSESAFSPSPSYMRPGPGTMSRMSTPLLSSPLRRPLGSPVVENPRTFLDMHADYERPSTKRIARVGGQVDLDWGENISPFGRERLVPAVFDCRRRVGRGRVFPVPENVKVERERERVFRGEFVDVPGLVGGGGGGGRGRDLGGSEVVAAPGEAVVAVEKKKGWQKVSAFLSRKMVRKGKGATAASSSALPSPSSSPAPPSPPATPPSLVWASSSNASPGPPTPVLAHAQPLVVVSRPPYPMPRRLAEGKHPVTPLRPSKRASSRLSLPVSSALQEHAGASLAHAATSIVAPRRDNDRVPTPSPPEEEEDEEAEAEEAPSPLSPVSDADLFPSPLVTSKRWARSQEEALHAAVADAIAEQEAAANWSGSLVQTERVEYAGKGKAKVVDVREKPSRYRGRRATVAEAPGSISGDAGGRMVRRDTLDEEKGKRKERAG